MRNLILTLGLLAVLGGGGCATTRENGPRSDELAQEHAINAGLKQAAHQARPGPNQAYVIDPPDIIEISVRDNPQLSSSQVRVGPDGMVSRPLIGQIRVGGRTVSEVTEELRALYGKFITKADVTVSVQSFNSKWIYVTSESDPVYG